MNKLPASQPIVHENGTMQQHFRDYLLSQLFDVVSQADAEAGTGTDVALWTPERVAQAIAALGGGGASPEYASFYQSTGGVTGLAATATTLNLSSTHVNSDGAIFALASNEVTVNKAADFKVTMDNYINSGGTSRSEYSLWLEEDTGGGYSEVPGSRHAVYARGYDSGQSASLVLIITVASGNKYRMRIQRTDGGATTGYQDDNGTRLTFEEMA